MQTDKTPTPAQLMAAASKRALASMCRRYADAYRASGRSQSNAETFAATADKHDAQALALETAQPVPAWT